MSDPPFVIEPHTDWSKNKGLVRQGFKDLAYLPRSRSGWKATLAAWAYSARRQIAGTADLNQWAVMHGCPASGRYGELEENALVLWHGASAARAEQIVQYGLFHKKGLWTALEPKIAHGFSRMRNREYRAGSATVVILLDGSELEPGVHYDRETSEVLRFHAGLPPESVEYILWDDRIEFLGSRKARQPKAWGVARFKKKEGQWVPRSRPPVRFDRGNAYWDLTEWLALSINRILASLGPAAAIEIFSSLYATLDPWDALKHGQVFEALERLPLVSTQRRGLMQFSLER